MPTHQRGAGLVSCVICGCLSNCKINFQFSSSNMERTWRMRSRRGTCSRENQRQEISNQKRELQQQQQQLQLQQLEVEHVAARVIFCVLDFDYVKSIKINLQSPHLGAVFALKCLTYLTFLLSALPSPSVYLHRSID